MKPLDEGELEIEVEADGCFEMCCKTLQQLQGWDRDTEAELQAEKFEDRQLVSSEDLQAQGFGNQQCVSLDESIIFDEVLS